MKTLLRIAAGLAFLFCFVAGLTVVLPALSATKNEGFLLVAVGLLFMGFGIFFGAILLATANRFVPKE